MSKNLGLIRSQLRAVPRDGYLWIEYGDWLSNNRFPRKALVAYRVSQKLCHSIDLTFRIARCYISAGENDSAIKAINEAHSNGDPAHANTMLALACLQKGSYELAEVYSRKALDICAEAEAYYVLGCCLEKRSKPEAEDVLRSAVDLDETMAYGWQALGRVLMSKKLFSEADNAFRTAVELDPFDAWSQLYLANVLWHNDCLKEAGDAYLNAISIKPDDSQIQNWYKQFLYATRDSE